MAPRSGIITGKTVIVVQVQESIDKALGSISSKLNKFSSSVGRFGLELFSGGLLGGIASKQITDTFRDFEDAILFLQTKLTATEQDFAKLEARIRELGRTTSFTAKEVVEAATVLAQGGLNALETLNTLQATLDLARAGQVTLTQSGDILINTMRSFGIETSKANEVASQFVAAARLGTLDILNLKESIKEVLGTVRVLNIDLPTTLALLTQMAERSLKGTKAGTSLNTALLNLAGKSEIIKKTLGITVPKDFNGEDFITFLEQLYTKINKLGNLQQVSILQRLFNIRGGRAITALDDIKKIIDLQKAIRGAGNEARNAAVKMDSGFGGSIRRATSAVESLGITLGGLFSKALIPILEVVPAVSAAFEKLAIANESLIIPMVLLPPTILGVGAGLLALSFIGGKVAGIVGLLAVSFKNLSSLAISGLNGQLVLLTRTMGVFFNRVRREGKGAKLDKKGGLLQSFDELLSAKLLSPQKVKKGASAGKVRPTSFFGRVGKADIATLNLVKKAMSSTVNVFEKGIVRLSRVFTLLDTAVSFFEKSFNSFVGSGAGLIGNLFKGIGSGVKSGAGGLGSLFGKGFRLLVSGLKNLPKLLDNSVVGLFKFFKAAGGIGLGLLRIANGIRRFVFSISGWLTIIELLILFGPKIGFIRDAFARLGEGFGKAFETIRGTAKDLEPVFALFGAAFKNIFAGEGELGIKGLIVGFTTLADIVKSNLKIAFLQVVEAVAPLYDFLRKITLSLLEIVNLVGSIFGATFSNIGASIQGLTGGGAGNLLGSISDTIKSIFSAENIKQAFSFVGTVLIEMARIVNKTIQDIFVVVTNLATFIQSAIVKIFTLINEAAGNSANNMDPDGWISGPIRQMLIGVAKASWSAATGATAEADANKVATEKITNSFETTSKALDGILKGFLDRLTSIFSVDTEANAKAAIAAARADKEAAQKAAAKQSRIQTQSGTPFGQVGGFLGGLASGGIGQLFGNMLKPGSDQMKALKEERRKMEEENDAAYKKYVDAFNASKKANPNDKATRDKMNVDERARQAVVKQQRNENDRRQQALFNKPSTSLFDMDFKGMGNAISNVAQTAAANVDPKAVMKQRRKDLNIEAKNLRERIKQTPRFLGMGGGAMGNDAIRQGLLQRLAENRQELAGLVAKPAALRAQMSRGSLQDIVSATVGTFRQTRGNLLKVAGGKSIDQQQLDTLRQVVDNTGGPSDSIFSVMKDLSNRADPFVFQ